jgi:hypothetical protein
VVVEAADDSQDGADNDACDSGSAARERGFGALTYVKRKRSASTHEP